MSTATTDFDRLSRIFSALANPTRLRILDRLKSGQATVSELAEPFSMSLPGITNHLNVLEKTGLIKKTQDAQWRHTHLVVTPLQEISDWLMKYQMIWENRLDNLEQFMKELRANESD